MTITTLNLIAIIISSAAFVAIILEYFYIKRSKNEITSKMTSFRELDKFWSSESVRSLFLDCSLIMIGSVLEQICNKVTVKSEIENIVSIINCMDVLRNKKLRFKLYWLDVKRMGYVVLIDNEGKEYKFADPSKIDFFRTEKN